MSEWPGADWFRTALALLDELSGTPRAAGYAIQLGSQLLEGLATPRHAEAILAYERALRDPEILRGAHQDGPGALLMAVKAAEASGRFSDGRRLLARIRLIFGNAKIIDEHDIALREAEERHARRAQNDAGKPDPSSRTLEHNARREAPRIVPTHEAPADETPADETPADEDHPGTPPPARPAGPFPWSRSCSASRCCSACGSRLRDVDERVYTTSTKWSPRGTTSPTTARV